MATITIKNIPDELYELLKERAENNKRSLNSEAILCLERAVRSYRPDPEEIIAQARILREGLQFMVTEEEINQAKNEGRP